MSIAPVTGIKVPVSFMANKKQSAKKEDINDKIEKIEVPDVSSKVDKFGKEATETVNSVGQAVTSVTGATAGVAAPLVGVGATMAKFTDKLFKVKTDIIDEAATKAKNADLIKEKGLEIDGKIDFDKLKEAGGEIVHTMKNSPWKIGAVIAVGVIVAGLAIKGVMDKKKADAAEAEAEAAADAAEAAEEAEEAAETKEVDETEETSEE